MRSIQEGAVGQSTTVRILAADGTPATSVTAATAGLDLFYRRDGAAPVSSTESDLASASAAWSAGGIKHVGAGYYRVDIPDAAWATGSAGTMVAGSATGLVVVGSYHPLVAYDPALLPAAVWALLMSDSAFAVPGGVGTAFKAIVTAPDVTAADIATAVWDAAPAGTPVADIAAANWSLPLSNAAFAVTGGVGKATKDLVTAPDVPMSDFKAEVVAALSTDTYAETSGVPVASSSLAAKLGWLFKMSRNKARTTAAGIAIRNDADSADSATTTHSDDGTTYTRNEWS